jgi:hypothetical protein
VYHSTWDLFYLKLSYEDVPSEFEEAPPQRNGNISSMIWQVASWNQQSCQFTYDPINRMKKAVYGDILPYTIFDPEAGGSTLVLLDDNSYGVDVPEYDPTTALRARMDMPDGSCPPVESPKFHIG